MPIREEKMEMKEMLCADFDATFDRLCEEKLLTWFPWVGKTFDLVSLGGKKLPHRRKKNLHAVGISLCK